MNLNSRLYIEQWLKTATKGNVTVEYSLNVARMRLHCNKCDITLTVREPEDECYDYSTQEFVKIHAHTGGHNNPPIKVALQPVPLTADFKPVLACPHGYVMWRNSCTVCRAEVLGIDDHGKHVSSTTGVCQHDYPRYNKSCPQCHPKKSAVLKIATGRKFR